MVNARSLLVLAALCMALVHCGSEPRKGDESPPAQIVAAQCGTDWDPSWQQGSGANNWWIEYIITDATVTSASLEVVGVRTIPLSSEFGKWLGSTGGASIAAGANVIVHAMNSAGQSAQTQPFRYLVDTMPLTDCPGTCTPSCAGRDCGDDGCGGPCGTCDDGQICVDGECTGGGGGGTCDFNPTWEQGSGANAWWVEYSITDGTITSTSLEVVGVRSVPLSFMFNKWVAPSGAEIVAGSDVILHATNALGQSAQTQAFDYLALTDPVTSCGPGCVPSCAGRECGDDGCGEPCGSCSDGQTCVDGDCVGGGGGDCAFNPTWVQGAGANNWWIEYSITGASITAAHLELVGGRDVPLSFEFGKWVGPSGGAAIGSGTSAIVHATNAAGLSAQTSPFGYLVDTTPITDCASGCGNAACEAGETCATCPGDCGVCGPVTGRIAFATTRAPTGLCCDVFLANPDGTGVVPLTPGFSPAWSPDGQRIAFESSDGIHTIDANGANEEFLVAGNEPTWSPDGTQLAYLFGGGSVGFPAVGGIFVINADGTNATLRLSHAFAEPPAGTGTTGEEYGLNGPAWSPDGGRIAFTRFNNFDGLDIYVMSATGSDAPSLAVEDASGAAWSPDSARLAYRRLFGDIASRTLGVPGETVHGGFSPSFFSSPAWSADGSSIIFGGATATGTRIFIVRDGLPPVQLIADATNPFEYSDFDPAWSWAD